MISYYIIYHWFNDFTDRVRRQVEEGCTTTGCSDSYSSEALRQQKDIAIIIFISSRHGISTNSQTLCNCVDVDVTSFSDRHDICH